MKVGIRFVAQVVVSLAHLVPIMQAGFRDLVKANHVRLWLRPVPVATIPIVPQVA